MALSKLLSRFVGAKVEIEAQGGRGTLQVRLHVEDDQHRKQRVYSFRPVDVTTVI